MSQAQQSQARSVAINDRSMEITQLLHERSEEVMGLSSS
jgi:hypothetical protein